MIRDLASMIQPPDDIEDLGFDTPEADEEPSSESVHETRKHEPRKANKILPNELEYLRFSDRKHKECQKGILTLEQKIEELKAMQEHMAVAQERALVGMSTYITFLFEKYKVPEGYQVDLETGEIVEKE